jgi:hypothetical protein
MPTPSLTKVDHARVTTVGLSDSPFQAVAVNVIKIAKRDSEQTTKTLS